MQFDEIIKLLKKDLNERQWECLKIINNDGSFYGEEKQCSDDYYLFEGKVIDNTVIVLEKAFSCWPSDVDEVSYEYFQQLIVLNSNEKKCYDEELRGRLYNKYYKLDEETIKQMKTSIIYSNIENLLSHINDNKNLEELNDEYLKINKALK